MTTSNKNVHCGALENSLKLRLRIILSLLRIILSIAKQSQGFFKEKKSQFYALPFALVILLPFIVLYITAHLIETLEYISTYYNRSRLDLPLENN